MKNENKKPSQCELIKKYLIDFHSITQYDALKDLGIMRLASRMNELKNDGFNFNTKKIEVFNRYGNKCYISMYYI